MPNILRIALTFGEPAGIGPDCLLNMMELIPIPPAEVIIIGDERILQQRAKLLKKQFTLTNYQPNLPAENAYKILQIPSKNPSVCGTIDINNSHYVLATLQRAATGCLKKEFAALVTAPIHKAAINQAGILFTGHTEFLTEASGLKKSVMMLAAEEYRVALVTTHLPLKDVPKHITQENVFESLMILNQGLQSIFKITKPIISVCGLNPHAGENGYLGREEMDVIQPAITRAQQQGMNVIGCVAADTMFLQYEKQPDAVLCMYHDQALPVIKHLAFGKIVNVTLGLPFLRVSVDHGTALTLAGTGKADASHLAYALEFVMEKIIT